MWTQAYVARVLLSVWYCRKNLRLEIQWPLGVQALQRHDRKFAKHRTQPLRLPADASPALRP